MADDDAEGLGTRPVRLSREAPFWLGPLEVRPATRQIIHDQTNETLEPRVMQVLVALARAQGAVVSREDLTASCWGGRIVGENATNRVISALRKLAAGPGADSFQIVTIARVGYRMTIPLPVLKASGPIQPGTIHTKPVNAPVAGTIDRRTLIVGSAVLAIAGASGAYLWTSRRHVPPPTAVALYRRGIDAQRQGLAEQTAQAISFLQEAVRVDPDYAEAWGALALSYRHRLQNDPSADQVTLSKWILSAAETALRLDPNNADGAVAKVLIKQHYGNWTVLDADYRAARVRYPGHWLLNGTFGSLMYNVGRWREGIEPFRANVARDAFLPNARYFLAHGLWNSGQLHEAEDVIDSAIARWPTHPALWFQRFWFLTYTGRPDAAIGFVENVEQRPQGLSDANLATLFATARAVESGGGDATANAIATNLDAVRRNPAATPRAVTALSVLGESDAAFALLAPYCAPVPKSGGLPSGTVRLRQRETDFLFALPTAPLRDDQRFAALVEAIGLEVYWRDTKSSPDYRGKRNVIRA